MNSNTKKTLEAVMLGGVLVVTLNSAMATQVCNLSTGSYMPGAAGTFVKTSFAPKCSANTLVDAVDNTTSFGVKSASVKGNQYYGGSTEGGGVTMCSQITGTPTLQTANGGTGC
jgi:hypothetical protein